jgi:hypothetical protein
VIPARTSFVREMSIPPVLSASWPRVATVFMRRLDSAVSAMSISSRVTNWTPRSTCWRMLVATASSSVARAVAESLTVLRPRASTA